MEELSPNVIEEFKKEQQAYQEGKRFASQLGPLLLNDHSQIHTPISEYKARSEVPKLGEKYKTGVTLGLQQFFAQTLEQQGMQDQLKRDVLSNQLALNGFNYFNSCVEANIGIGQIEA